MNQGSKMYQKLKVSLSLYGKDLLPNYWTSYFGVNPVTWSTKDSLTYWHDQKPTPNRLKIGRWFYESLTNFGGSTIDEKVFILRQELGFPRPDFRQRIASQGITAKLWVYVDNDGGDNPPDYGQVTIGFLEETGATLELDVYQDDPSTDGQA